MDDDGGKIEIMMLSMMMSYEKFLGRFYSEYKEESYLVRRMKRKCENSSSMSLHLCTASGGGLGI